MCAFRVSASSSSYHVQPFYITQNFQLPPRPDRALKLCPHERKASRYVTRRKKMFSLSPPFSSSRCNRIVHASRYMCCQESVKMKPPRSLSILVMDWKKTNKRKSLGLIFFYFIFYFQIPPSFSLPLLSLSPWDRQSQPLLPPSPTSLTDKQMCLLVASVGQRSMSCCG